MSDPRLNPNPDPPPNSAGPSTPGTVPSDHPDAPHPSAGGLPQIDGYSVLGLLGEGGMGTVYLAEDTRLLRRVAIKTLKREMVANALDRERFLREARAVAMVEHDNIVPILHVGEASDGTPFLVMPLLQGETLADVMRRQSVAPLDLVLKVAREVAEGLAAAHAKGLIHRDVKPANVWLEGDSARPARRVKLLDFGLARSATGGDSQLTASGAILGTPAYMSPEQARGERLDHRADLFSLGVVLYRMATGRPPFRGDTSFAVLAALITEDPPPVRSLAPDLPPELADLIDRLMAKDPARRPQSAEEVARVAREITIAGPAARPRAAGSALHEIGGGPASASLPYAIPEVTDRPAPPVELRPRQPSTVPSCAAAILVAAAGALALALWLTGVIGGKKPAQEVAQKEEPPPKVDGPQPEPPKKADPKQEPVKADPNRDAALAVLSLGGRVNVDAQEREITAAGELPKAPFRVTRVVLADKPQARADALAAFKECEDVGYLGLLNTPVGDAGLAHFSRCKGLNYAYLGGTGVTSAGLAALKDCTRLRELNLSNTPVDDAALALLKSMTELKSLSLQGTKVSAAGAADLKKALPGCQVELDATTTPDGDADRKAAEWALSTPEAEGSLVIDGEGDAIKSVKGLPKRPFRLTSVTLIPKLKGTQLGVVKAADLAVFKDCKNVTGLFLAGAGITNEALAHFSNCKDLKSLYLSGTKVDDKAAGVIKQFTKLEDLVLGATDFTDKGVIEVAGSLPGCRIQYGATFEPATEADRKAAEYVLSSGGKVGVNYGEKEIRDAKDLPKELFRLTFATLTKPVKDADLAVFEECKNLALLHLVGTDIRNAGLAHFKGCVSLSHLSLSGTKVDDASVPVIKQFARLKDLAVGGTGITEKGVKELAQALPECRIQHNGGTIGPKK